jgi:hypothetical protein
MLWQGAEENMICKSLRSSRPPVITTAVIILSRRSLGNAIGEAFLLRSLCCLLCRSKSVAVFPQSLFAPASRLPRGLLDKCDFHSQWPSSSARQMCAFRERVRHGCGNAHLATVMLRLTDKVYAASVQRTVFARRTSGPRCAKGTQVTGQKHGNTRAKRQ